MSGKLIYKKQVVSGSPYTIDSVRPDDNNPVTSSAVNNALTDLEEKRSYSTNEHWTGKYWIDGKKIYQKTFVYTGTVNASVHFEIPYIDIITDNGTLYRNGESDCCSPICKIYNKGLQNAYVTCDWSTAGSWGTNQGIFYTIEYTKTTD